MRFTIKAKIITLCCVFLLIFVPSLLILLRNLTAVATSFKETVYLSNPVTADVHDLIKLIVDMETGQRGFIITGKEAFLEPYNKANEEFGRKLKGLKQSLSHRPEYLSYLEKIEHLRANWLGRAGNPEIELRRQINKSEVSLKSMAEMVHSAMGKRIIDKIRDIVNTMSEDFRKSNRKDELILITQISKDVVDSETGVRGFLYAGEDKFLEPYYLGRHEFSKHAKTIKRLLYSDKDNLQKVAHIEKLYKEWLTKVAKPEIEARIQYEKDPLSMDDIGELLGKGRGKAIIDEIRDVAGRFIDDLTKEMDRALSLSEEKTKFVRVVSIVVSIVGIFLSIGFAFLLFNSIVTPINLLLKGTKRVGEGELDHTIEVKSKDELGLLAQSFNKMTEDLRVSRDKIVSAKEYTENIITSMTDMLIVINRDGTIRTVNRASLNLLGYKEDELIGKHVSTIFAEGELTTGSTGIDDLIDKGFIANVEKTYLTKDNREVPVLFSGSVMGDDDHAGEGIVCVALDITERKRLEEALSAERHRLDITLHSIGDGVISTDNKGNVLLINKVAEELTGWIGEEAIGKPLLQVFRIINEKTRKPVENPVEKVLESGSVVTLANDTTLISKDGTERIIADSAAPVRDKAGNIAGAVMVFRDFTERKHLERELEIFKQFAESSDQGFGIARFDKKIVYTNHALLKIIGEKSLDHIKDSSFSKYYNEKSLKRIDLVVIPALMKEGSWTGELEIISAEGSIIPTFENFFVIRDWDGTPLYVADVITDFTERKRRECDLIEARKTAVEASRLKSEFLANMSHEIRTPLNGIVGMTELLEDSDLTDEQRKFLDMVKSSTDSLLSVINDILDFSKIEAGRLDLEDIEFKLRDSIGDTLKILGLRAHGKGLELACSVSPEAPELVRGDPGRVRQIIVNLVGNAIKFTVKGEVVVNIDVKEQSDDDVLLHFSIRDTGIGIPEGRVKRIFDPFTQVDGSVTRKYGGTGLGLAISRELILMMGGEIWVESEEGKGSVFHFTARLGMKQISEEERLPVDIVNMRELSVLVVDDNATNRQILKEMLERWEMFPTVVEDGLAALESIESCRGEGKAFDLILSDVHMPEISGFTLVKRIKESLQGEIPPVILLTSSGQRGDAEKCRDLGISAYLMKPVKQSEMMDAIVTIFGKKGVTEETPLITRHQLRENRENFNILLAEDNMINQEAVKRMLARYGHTITIANNGKEVLLLLENNNFDLILMDVQMPEMDGFQTTAIIRDPLSNVMDPTIPIIAMTAHAMKGDREKCLEAGMDDYIAKPIRRDTLFEVLNREGKKRKNRKASSAFAKVSPHLKNGETGTPDNIFDRGAAINRVDGDIEGLTDIAGLFLERSQEMLGRIGDAIKKGDLKEAGMAAHSIKGTVSLFFAERSKNAAIEVEEMANRGEMSNLGPAFERLQNEIKLLSEALGEMLG